MHIEGPLAAALPTLQPQVPSNPSGSFCDIEVDDPNDRDQSTGNARGSTLSVPFVATAAITPALQDRQP
jgi:hypothetical protein